METWGALEDLTPWVTTPPSLDRQGTGLWDLSEALVLGPGAYLCMDVGKAGADLGPQRKFATRSKIKSRTLGNLTRINPFVVRFILFNGGAV